MKFQDLKEANMVQLILLNTKIKQYFHGFLDKILQRSIYIFKIPLTKLQIKC